MKFDRRQFLAGVAGVSVAASTLRPSAALDLAASALGAQKPIRKPGSRPFPKKPVGVDMLPKIKHVVIVMMENHSYDNYLGHLGRGDGLPKGVSLPDATGAPVEPFHLPTTCQAQTGNVSPGWDVSHAALGNNDNSGFASAIGKQSMGFYTEDDLPFYNSLARTFPLCDRWFSSCLAPTYPNRRFMQAGTAAGLIETRFNSINDPLPANGVIFEQLDAHDITWTDYYNDLPQAGLYLAYAQQHADKLKKIDQFYVDARSGKLPFLSLVDCIFEGAKRESEEDPSDVQVGEAFVAKVVNALFESPAWPHTMMIWLYDEAGGYYDHVVPPRAIEPDDIPARSQTGELKGRYDRYGFRVPAVVVSPYARRKYVSHVVHDHTTVLKLIETKWNLPALTYRDANADNLLDTLDLHGRPRFLDPPKLAAAALEGATTCVTA